MTASKQTVLVTGATGYIGAHVVRELLQKGYRVRAAVRTQKKADMLAARFPTYKDKLEFVFVDLSQPNFESVLDGITGVFHVAAPLPGALKTSVKVDFLDPAIEGNLALLRAVAKSPSIKRVVLTSSVATMLGASEDPLHVYNEKDWNPATYEQAVALPLKPGDNDFPAYLAAKTLAEKAAFDFVELNKPHFDIVTILPTFVFGPAEVAESAADISSLRNVLDHITTKKEADPTLYFCHQVDVREVALAHVLAYENPKAANQRYIISQGPYAFQEIVDIAHEAFPGKTNAPTTRSSAPLPQHILIDSSKSEKELGIVYRSKRDTLVDSISNLLELKQQGRV